MSLGEKLRKARAKKKLTVSQVAQATRMKAQTVEMLENEDFSKIAAPIYGKGFIKLYAEHVGLDPQPLIREYMGRFVEPESPPEPSLENVRYSSPQRKPAPGEEPAGTRSEEPEHIRGHFREESAPEKDSFAPRWTEEWKAKLKQAFLTALTKCAVIAAAAGRGWRTALDFCASGSAVRTVSIAAGIIVVLVFLISSMSRCAGPDQRQNGAGAGDEPIRRLEAAVNPPEPYFDDISQ
ncbi:MAG: helix-turn-helix transcriptional regulator [Kiritimatiellia bacterium]